MLALPLRPTISRSAHRPDHLREEIIERLARVIAESGEPVACRTMSYSKSGLTNILKRLYEAPGEGAVRDVRITLVR
jgi:hypothetical protein